MSLFVSVEPYSHTIEKVTFGDWLIIYMVRQVMTFS